MNHLDPFSVIPYMKKTINLGFVHDSGGSSSDRTRWLQVAADPHPSLQVCMSQ